MRIKLNPSVEYYYQPKKPSVWCIAIKTIYLLNFLLHTRFALSVPCAKSQINYGHHGSFPHKNLDSEEIFVHIQYSSLCMGCMKPIPYCCFFQRISRDILLKNLETDDDFLCGNVERWNDRFFDCCIFLSSSRSLEANIASVCFLRLQYRVLNTYGHTKFSSTFLTIKEFQVFLFWHNDPK